MRLKALTVLALAAPCLQAQRVAGTVAGTVRDPLGALVPNALVEALDPRDPATALASASSDEQGRYTLTLPRTGRFQLRVTAPTFVASLTPPTYFGPHTQQFKIDLTTATPTDTQEVTVTATGAPTLLAQSGAPITVLEAAQFPHSPELQQPLRLVPGLQLTQAGQTGAITSLFIRGGDASYNKVLLDGVPFNDIGGAVNFGNLASVGIAQIEVLRQPNSSLYGSDALAGVVSFTTARGTTPLPLLAYSVDGGTLGFFRQSAELSGAHNRFDFYNAFARLQTGNNEPLDQFHNVTFAGNYGFAPDAKTDLRFTFRHLTTNSGQPNAIALYGIPDQANAREQDTYLNATAQHQTTLRWHNLLRYGSQRLNGSSVDYAPSGTLYTTPGSTFGLNGYIGNQVTLTGANGYTVSGQALLDFTGTYPSPFTSTTRRDFVYVQSDFSVSPALNFLGAYKYESERGGNAFDGIPGIPVDLRNQSFTAQFGGDLHTRFFYTLGSGIEHNQVYGNALTPRVALAFYALRPGSQSFFSGTKLHASFGKGVKEGTVSEQTTSLFALLQQNGLQNLINQFNIRPVGGEFSRTYDVGVEQQFGNGRARLNATYFHNEFTGGIQFVSPDSLINQFGLPAPAVNAGTAASFGAYVNAQAFRAQGAELETEYRVTRRFSARAGYTYLDAVIQRSFSSDALFPTFNPSFNFSTVPIGAFAPLVGARPFRRAPHSGYFALSYALPRFTTQLSGTFVGRRDDSTFLSDKDFGNSLLLPNRNLDGAYQRLELTADYRISPHITAYTNIQNLLNENYQEAFGYPALPINFRAGARFTFGGESFKVR